MTEYSGGKGKVYCLVLQEWKDGDEGERECWACLILASVDGDAPIYKRLGVGFLRSKGTWGWEMGKDTVSCESITIL